MGDSPAEMARIWLRAWDSGDLGLLGLAPDVVHTGPFVRIEGSEEYLRIIVPMAEKSVVRIAVKDVIEGQGRAAVTYELVTPAGRVEASDRVFVENGLIREVNAYYASSTNRKALEM